MTTTAASSTGAESHLKAVESHSNVVEVPLGQLAVKALLRSEGIDVAHVKVLEELEGRWPPILISRQDCQIIDGLYRFHAAKSLGYSKIACVYFEGTRDEAYLEALRRNTQHGLPLTLEERKRAAVQALRLRYEWSDRRVAELVGLSATTVASIRSALSCPTDRDRQLDTKRVGRDGRTRRRDGIVLRQQIATAIHSTPRDSLRQIASRVGSSPETVRKVRAEMMIGVDNRSSTVSVLQPHNHEPDEARGPRVTRWTTDSALNSTPIAKQFSVWFASSSIDDEWHAYLAELPISRVYEVADEARRRARCWAEFAKALESKVSRTAMSAPRGLSQV